MTPTSTTLPNCPFGRRDCRLDPAELTTEDKTWLGMAVNTGKYTTAQLAQKYQLNQKLISYYAKAVREGVVLHSKGGRPTRLSPLMKEKLKSDVVTSDYAMREEEFIKKANDYVKEEALAKNIAPSSIKELSRRTLGRIEEELSIKTGHAEATTTARHKAVSDVRNAVSFAAMNQLMAPITSSHLILNADATQFTVGYDSKKKIVVKYVEKKGPLKVLPSKMDAGTTKYFIKYYCLISAFGNCADPVYILADDAMKKDEIDVYTVPGLHIGTQMAGRGYVVFCNSRVGNAAFYEWFQNNILIPYVKETRQHYDLGDDAIAWYQLDGESTQIDCYSDEHMIDELKENFIVLGKPPGSTTSTTQPCDAGNCFKGPKTTNKRLSDHDVIENECMIKSLNETISTHTKKYHKSQLTPARKKMAVYGLLRTQLALRLSMRGDMIQESFAVTGIYPFSVEQILRNCKTKLTLPEETRIYAAMPFLVDTMMKHGEIRDEDFERCGIANPSNTFKDKLIIPQRRSIILTNVSLIQREKDKKDRIAREKAEAAERAQKKKDLAAERKALRESKKTTSKKQRNN